LRRNNQLACQLLDYTGVRHLETVYEELRKDTSNFFPIFEFLGVNDQSAVPQSELVKLVQADYGELISNYAQLEQRLAQTEFAGLLQERGTE
jgi:LPS sulfotransferase NodH